MMLINLEGVYDEICEIKGRKFKIERIPVEIEWKCPNCGTCNYEDDYYLEHNYGECDECGEWYCVNLDDNNEIESILTREENEGRY